MKQVFTLPLKLLCSADFLTLIVMAVGQLWSKKRLDGYKYVYTDWTTGWAGCFNKSNVNWNNIGYWPFDYIKKGYNHLLNSFIKDKKLLKVNKEIGYSHLVFYQLMYEIDIEYFSLFEVSYVPMSFLPYFLTTPPYTIL